MRFRFRLHALAAILLAGCVASTDRTTTDSGVPLVSNGVFNGRIYVSAAADESEREAASHLAAWLGRVCGVIPEVAVEPGAGLAPGIYVGATKTGVREGVAHPSRTLSGETAVRETRGGRAVFIVGASPAATRRAVAVFSREVLGVAFLMPGVAGADWVSRRDVVVPGGVRRWDPSFIWRAISIGTHPDEREWAMDNGFGELPSMSHNLHAVFDAGVYAKNPDLFPLIDGVRHAPGGRAGYEPQPNLAHPGAPLVAAAAARSFAAANPGANVFSLCINDTTAWDTSPESEAAFGAVSWFRGRRNRTDYVFRFMNATAAELDKSGPPDLSLTAYAYYECEAPPSFTLNRRVFPILTADRSEWRDPVFAREDAELMAAWARSGCSLWGVYDYYYGREMVMPRVFFRAQADSMRHAAKLGASLFYAEMQPDWAFDGPKAWLTARLAEDASADAEALLAEYFDRAYGPAAAPMRRFYEGLERVWTNRAEAPRWIRFYREESFAALFPGDIRRELGASLREALAALDAVSSGDFDERLSRRRRRVLATIRGWERADVFAEWYEARAALEALPPARGASGLRRVHEAYERCERLKLAYKAACSRWAYSELNPGTPFDARVVFGGDYAGMAAYKCNGLFPESGFVSESMIQAVSEGDPDYVLWRETFPFSEFASPPVNGVSPGPREMIPPLAPSVAKVREGEFARFGPDASRSHVGPSSLLIAGTDQAGLARRFPIQPGDTVGATVMYSGLITPGEHVAVYLRFVNESGGAVGRMLRGIAFPGGDDAWRPLAVAGVAPHGAAYADVTLRVTSQDARDAVWFDDLCVRRIPAPE